LKLIQQVSARFAGISELAG